MGKRKRSLTPRKTGGGKEPSERVPRRSQGPATGIVDSRLTHHAQVIQTANSSISPVIWLGDFNSRLTGAATEGEETFADDEIAQRVFMQNFQEGKRNPALPIPTLKT
eukprot:763100-Hanusia_phi.AAC.17